MREIKVSISLYQHSTSYVITSQEMEWRFESIDSPTPPLELLRNIIEDLIAAEALQYPSRSYARKIIKLTDKHQTYDAYKNRNIRRRKSIQHILAEKDKIDARSEVSGVLQEAPKDQPNCDS